MTDLNISVEEARALVLAHCGSAPLTRVSLAQAAGTVLREPLAADRDFPPYDRATMDGYALRAGDVQGPASRLRVVGFCAAGSPGPILPEEAGACIEIGTGAVCPAGADCVVPYEAAYREGDRLLLRDKVYPKVGDFLHRQGSDARAGEPLVSDGTRLGAREIAIAASVGKADLLISEAPRVAILATGDELVDVGQAPAPHQIRASNLHALGTACSGAGYAAQTVGRLPDETGPMKTALEAALATHDLLVTTGSVSKGKTDFLPGVLQALGCTRRFHGVRQRPGKPMGFWTGPGGQLIFALPGNPVSCLVGFQIYVVAALDARAGLRPAPPAGRLLAEAVTFTPLLTWFCPAVLRQDGAVTPRPTSNSGDFIHLMGTAGLIEFPADISTFQAEEVFTFHSWV